MAGRGTTEPPRHSGHREDHHRSLNDALRIRGSFLTIVRSFLGRLDRQASSRRRLGNSMLHAMRHCVTEITSRDRHSR